MASRRVKQVLITNVKTDPPMRKGKMIAQACHASIAFLTRSIGENWDREIEPRRIWDEATRIWMVEGFTKIGLQVDSEEALRELYDKAQDAGLKAYLIVDSGETEFNGRPTATCLAIGPDYSDEIDKITGNLKLL
ncbi:MAG: aminoacyl-tRNA hydrolase [Nitrosomonadaceae bacterium]|nr:aminoacyl-tRNA hydrolase [Nitrosomonadaceae bacterium]